MNKTPEQGAEALPMFMLGETEPEEAPTPSTSWIERASLRVARFEAWAAAATVLLIFVLLLVNVASRSFGVPLIWTDELAVNLMAWAAFIGASLGLAHRQHIAVTLVVDLLPTPAARILAVVVDLALLTFVAVLAALVWRWFDPVGLIAAGSVESFGAATFNFLYQEPTVTLGVQKFWFWLVLPLFCLTSGLHVLAGLAVHVADCKDLLA